MMSRGKAIDKVISDQTRKIRNMTEIQEMDWSFQSRQQILLYVIRECASANSSCKSGQEHVYLDCNDGGKRS